MAEKYPNSGVLFKNDRKSQPNHPDYKGNCTITIDGVECEFWMSSWVKTSKKDGSKFMSFSFQEKNAPQGGGSGRTQSRDTDNEDVPF